MASINKNPAYMALPSGIKRGVAAALDTTSVWYDYDKMVAYAKGGAEATAAGVAVTSYVGQILTLVNEAEKIATAYVILNAEGALQEVGSSTLGDDKTITLKDGVLGLKNWGVEYYAYNAETGEHVKQVVDETHPWIAGLEPRATIATDGSIEIAWYQPSTTTIEDVSSIVEGLQASVNSLQTTVGSAEDDATKSTIYGEIAGLEVKNTEQDTAISEKLPLAGGTMTGDITLKDGSVAASVSVVEAKIASSIGSAGHLKREIVETLPEPSAADPDTIYMIKKSAESTEYDEYILVNGAFEKIGDTAVDLTPYMKKVSDATANNFAALNANGEVIDAGVKADTFVQATAFETYKGEMTTALAGKVSTDDATYTSLAGNAEKLAALPAITEIGSGLQLQNGVLTGAQEYTLPTASDTVLGGVKVDNQTTMATAEGVLSVKVVAENGLSIGENGITLAAATTTSAGAMTAEQATRLANIEAGAQVNTVNGALLGIGGAEVDINEDKMLVLPIAGPALGLVKSSDANNQIKVETDGTMTINSVATAKLYVPEGDELVLYGGAAV